MWWATKPSQQCKDTNYLLVHLFPWSLHTPLGTVLDVLMFNSSTGKTFHSYYTPKWFWNLLYKPTSRKVFLAAAVKISSPGGVRVLKPTVWQQGLCSTLHISQCSPIQRYSVTEHQLSKNLYYFIHPGQKSDTYFQGMSTPVSLSFHLHLKDNNWSY